MIYYSKVTNNILLRRKLPDTMREANCEINIKKCKSISSISTSFLNTDYKILSEIMVTKLLPTFKNNILPSQNTGIPNRRNENI